ncbi:beta-galactosidase trimerization domain-containing protein [Nocardia sp. NPDC088792]|uniref:beta-galactosidase trimerization domain-containing protein n=1 Tax=Nocardia sp. NPDC088792 TaxID=3364332 RepID=UPI0037FC6C53
MSFAVRDGGLHRNGRPFLAVGVDYHPSVAGCRIWTDWDPLAIEADFTRMAAAGLNTVRLFVFWRDFEPAAGHIDPVMLHRLDAVLAAAERARLVCVVSLFTIWMNGQRLDLSWREGRSLWRDPGMLDREEEFARTVARAVGRRESLLGFDLGDEIGCIDPAEAAALTADDIACWQVRLAAALREEAPDVLVLQANDASGVLGPSPFGPDNSEPLDLIGIHGFPLWAPGSIESTLSYKATTLPAFLVKYAAAYGVPLVDELGSYGVADDTAAAYLRAAAASAIANGANGLFVWCWQDIAAETAPYLDRPGERGAGLRRLDGSEKPAMHEFRRIARAAGELAVTRSCTRMADDRTGTRRRPRIAVYLPRRGREASASYLDTGVATLGAFFCHLLLTRAHLDFEIAAGDLDGYDLVLCPSPAHLTLSDQRALRGVAERGGTVYCSLGDHLHGFPGADLVGAEIIDYAPPSAGHTAFEWDGQQWEIDWSAAPTRATTLRATAAEVLGSYRDGTPALVCNRIGEGRVLFTNTPFERQLDRPGRLAAAPWEQFYRRIAALAGIAATADCDDPDLELIRDHDTDRLIVINHGDTARVTDIRWDSDSEQKDRIELGPKDWTILHPHSDEERR